VAAPVEQARHEVLATKVKHADGTTWYHSHALRSLRVLATKGITVFGIFSSATKEALAAWIGTRGTLVSDRGSQLVY
jgi:hypothetical protein